MSGPPTSTKLEHMGRLPALLFILCTTLACRGQATPTIVCFGDSLTAGQGAAPGAAYPDALRQDLARAGYHVTVLNQGVSGDTTKDGKARLRAVVAAHPGIVLLEFGANDGLRGQPVPGIERNLSDIIEALQRAHIRVLLLGMELPPNLGPDYVGQFDGIYPALAARYKLSLVPFLLKDVYGNDDLMSQDYIHPNGAGYQKVAANVQTYLLPLLKK